MESTRSSTGSIGSYTGTWLLTVAVAAFGIWIGYPQPKLDMKNMILPMLRTYSEEFRKQELMDGVVHLSKLDNETSLLKGTIILITGATSGIGLSLTRFVCQYGATVLALGRSNERLQSLVNEYPNNVIPYQVELSNLQSVSNVAKEIKKTISTIHIIVNNAGIHAGTRNSNFATKSSTDLDEVFVVNYLSHFLLTELLADIITPSSPESESQATTTGSQTVPFSPRRLVQITSSFHYGGRTSFLVPQQEQVIDADSAHTAIIKPPLASIPGKYIGSIALYGQQSYANSKLAQIYHGRMLQTTHSKLSKIPIVYVCPTWVATNIVQKGEPGADLLSYLGFPANGYGISSALYAMFSHHTHHIDQHRQQTTTTGNSISNTKKNIIWNCTTSLDYISNIKSPFHSLLIGINKQLERHMVHTGLFDMFNQLFIAVPLLFFQKFIPRVHKLKSSKSSYNQTVANDLYNWSYERISEYL